MLASGILVGNTLLLILLTNVFGVVAFVAKIVVEVVMFIVSYLVQKNLIFVTNFQHKFVTIGFSLLLVGSTAYILLDTFVLEQRYQTVSSTASSTTSSTSTTASSTISVKTYTTNNTTIYVADIVLAEGQTIQSALADNTYGKNITATTSSMAESAGASLAINGDYYGARSSGYVIRNGELLRSTKASDSQEDMVLWSDGTMTIITEGDYTAQELLDKGAVQVLSFGPGLIIDGEISVDSNDEVGKAMASNPRTAVGYLGDNHYVLVVADGRTSASEGLSLLQLAEFMQTLGVSQAYNLDGGGSSTMYYDGEVINNPTTNGSVAERKVSDILYVT